MHAYWSFVSLDAMALNVVLNYNVSALFLGHSTHALKWSRCALTVDHTSYLGHVSVFIQTRISEG